MVQVYRNEEWIEVKFKDICVGEKFKYEDDPRIYEAKGNPMWDEQEQDYVILID